MKKKILTLLLFAIMTLSLVGCSKEKEKNKDLDDNKTNVNESSEIQENLVKKLYDMVEVNFISEVYPDFASYKDSNFYMDKEVKYEDLSDESRLYYAYKTIENVERRWFKSCDELKNYTYQKEDISVTCNKSGSEIIAKDQSSEEWFFNNVNKETLEKAYHTMYGEDKKLPLKDFTMSVTGICVYSVSKDDFLCFNQTGSDSSPGHGETQYEKIEQKDDSIEIYDRYIWSNLTIDGEVYYKSRFKDEKIDSTTKDFSKGALYKHTFKKDSKGNYYWYSSERVE